MHMQEPIRTLRVQADANGVRPSNPQYAGVQGEHNATRVIFALDEALLRAEYRYRFEFVDSMGGLDAGGEATPVDGELSCLLPEPWTRAGGCGTLRLCAVAAGADGQEEQVVYTLPALLTFATRESAGPLEDEVKSNLSALMTDAREATDAANEAAESANAAADKVDEAVSSANAATANANRAAASADASAATANAAAGGAQEAKEAADTAASGANTAAEQARTAAASANTAAGTASTAASNANAVADAVQAKLDAGELKGEKGDTGPQGPQGVSGVYVGDGDMPEGYTVQVDPTGDMLCYTAGESDSRYLRATEIRRPFTGGGITLTDADDAAFGGVTVLGATTEAGTGDKGPDNPYALTGVQPASLTVCGRNMIPYPYTSLPSAVTGISFADNGDGTITVNGTAEDETAGRLHFLSNLLHLPAGTYTLSGCAANGSGNTWCLQVVRVINGVEDWGWLCREFGTGITFTLTEATDIYIRIRLKKGTVINNGIFKPQLEFGTAATPYTPYTGQTVPLPALEPLYGTGDIRDEYDAATGVENRRWKRLVFDGTENWGTTLNPSGNRRYYIQVPDSVFYSKVSQVVCSHWASIAPGLTYQDVTGITLTPDTVNKSIWLYDSRFAQADLPTFKAYLNAQATAGTPVTVVYQLDAPVVAQHGPQRIPTYPGCTNLMLDISAEGAVRYPLSAPMQWDAKADKTAADDRYANVLTGAASGSVAALEDVSPTGALRRAAVLGATTETGEGDKSPDNPYTLAGVQPTKVTVCGKNLLPVTRSTPVTQGGITLTPLENGLLKLSGTCTANNNCPVFCTQPVRLDGTLTATVTVQSGTAEFVGYNLVQYNGDIQGLTLVNMKTKEHHFQRTCMASGFNIRMDAGTVFNDYVFGIQLEKGDTATPYEPYTGQTITLPALEPLYGDGTVNDEYDAVSGVETRRWKRVVFDGTESMRCEAHGNGQRYVSIDLDAAANKSVMPISTHYTSSAWTQDNNKVYIPNPVVMVITDSRFTTLQAARDILAAQYAAGTPVTVVYQLAEPVITQHDPARILPPAPVCRVFADAGNTAVGYNRDINRVVAKLEAALNSAGV